MPADPKENDMITLAIESAIRGGSISLIADGSEIDNWIGSTEVSKAEDLLVDIDAMLDRNGLSIRDIDHIVVSAGPGSFTGIRIGIATALGLKTGLRISMSSISALSAMAETSDFDGQAIVAVPVGRNAICIQTFRLDKIAIDEPRSVSFEEFGGQIQDQMALILHGSLYEQFGRLVNSIDFGENIALAIGQICIKTPGTMTEPLFISKAF